jgi:pimeloyl-ACP methyl ester carboxylesterase
LLGVYVLVFMLMLVFEERLAFAGATFKGRWQGIPKKAVVEDVMIRTPHGNSIHTWWLPPPKWTPADGAVLYVHGNGGNITTYGKTLTKWRDEMQTGVMAFDYPGYGRSTGTPNEQSCYTAATAAFDWLVQEKKVAAKDVIIVGQSMGGAIATELAARRRCRMLLTFGTFTSFPDIAQEQFFCFPARYFVRSRLDNRSKIGNLDLPVFIAHGREDRVVSFEHGERLFAVAREPKRFFPIAAHGHAPPKSREFFTAVRQFLEETKQAPVASAAIGAQ